MEKLHLSIGGQPVEAQDYFEFRSEISGDLIGHCAAASPDLAVKAVESAEGAFAAWSTKGPNARRAVLMSAAAELEARADVFVRAMQEETGSTEGWARFNLMLGASMLREAACLTTQIGGEVIPSDRPGALAMAVREPAGVVLGIAPWNAPIILGVRAVAVPLACGNTVVLKASEQCPRTHSLIIESLIAAGLNSGEVNLVSNAPEDAGEVVGAMIDHPAVRRVNFTGSTAVGRIIAQRAAKNLKPALLELGGKAPFVVLEDANLDEAVKAAAFGAYMNQGQICMSTERVILVEAIAEEFIRRFEAKVKTLLAGDPRDGKTPLGAVVNKATVTRVQTLVNDAVGKGAKVIGSGQSDGVLVSAIAVTGVTKEMRIYSEESFGPVTAIIIAADESEAVKLANDSDYGLSAAVFTADTARGLRVARQIKSGICHVNGPTVADEAQMPFGGVKNSGYGRFGGKAGIEAFTELRWITMAGGPGHYPI